MSRSPSEPPPAVVMDSGFALRAPRNDEASHRRYLTAIEIDGGAMHPGGARGDEESDEVGDVVHLPEAGDAEAAAHLSPRFLLRPAGALHLSLDAPPQPVGLDHARVNAVDLDAVLLAAIGEALGEGGDRGVDRSADGELRGGL